MSMSAAAAAGNGIPDVRGKRVLVYSLGLEGRDLATWMLRQGARVTMSDTRSDSQLADAGAVPPPGLDAVVTGKPLLDADGFDLVAVSQSVLRHSPALVRARSLGVPVTSQMRLFLQLCPGRVIGITGSSGKSTTTALVGAMAAEAGIPHVVGGNIGEPLLGRLEEIAPTTTVILEVSHTQLQYTGQSPAIAAVTNVTPNHLDQFNWDEYVGLKRNILAHQASDDVAILNADDQTSRALATSARGRVRWTSLAGEVSGDGAWMEDDRVLVREGRRLHEIMPAASIRLRGRHNLANVVMACAIGAAAGFAYPAIAAAAASFRGVPHRLELVGSAGGVTWVNDSIATSPERTMAGLNSFDERIVLLLGGREKNLPLDGLQQLARERCRAVVCFGESGALFRNAMAAAGVAAELVPSLDRAVSRAAALARPGDVVLLSPAATSFDAYPGFEVRGQAFRDLVAALPGFNKEVAP
ncbi:MAG: UDP-N-acetylmuramoyl-L-alanine--D-glutamate ligase [Dehalococcoidia bacterium]|nr:UDP-N-acetylmuramoyl-L-alanine--D-glutamate ligase [Dehalococcoidia bacterium]RIL02686.1 MAG: UDP-N-acetylmuramoyl-L-alanine--D-glutamate ligase [bacterium]